MLRIRFSQRITHSHFLGIIWLPFGNQTWRWKIPYRWKFEFIVTLDRRVSHTLLESYLLVLWKQHQTHRPQSMENLLLRVQANVAKEFEVEKDVAPWQKNGWALIWVWITIKDLEDHRWFSRCLAWIIRFLGYAILTHIHLSLRLC